MWANECSHADRKEDGLWFLVGNLHGNSDLCIDIILAVAVPGLTGRIVTTGRLFPVSEQYHFPLWRMSLFSCLLVRLPLHTVGGEGSAGDSGSSRSSLCPLPCIGIIGLIVGHLTQARPIKVLLWDCSKGWEREREGGREGGSRVVALMT